MYRFSYVKSVAGQATEVSRELFHQLIKSEKVKSICAKIAQATDPAEIAKLKRSLPAFCWHAWFDEGKRKNYAAHASGLVMIDVDHIDTPRALFDSLSPTLTRQEGECLEGFRLVAAHITPSTNGLRLVFAMPKGWGLTEAQTKIVQALQLTNVDACTKDLARLSFCVPEEYFLYLDEEKLFGADTDAGADNGADDSRRKTAGGEAAPVPSDDADSGEKRQRPATEVHPSAPAAAAPSDKASTERTGKTFEENYDGIPYQLIVECLQELLGGVPAHGSRNNFIFAMAAYLRYVCNDDADWIASLLPTYGEAAERWRRTIDSACQRAQYKAMPLIVKRALDNARSRLAQRRNPDSAEQLPPAMPKKLPKLIAHLVKNVPEVCRPAVANAVFPALATHLKGVTFRLIDGTEKEATFMCVTMARQSSGKSAVNKPIEYIVADIVERDEINRRREQEWKDASATKGANKEKPKRPDDLCVQVLVSDMTNAAFVQRMKDAGGRYLYTNIEELDLLKQLQTNGTKDVGKIICLCFDNGKYGQERVGTQSVTARVNLRWNWNAASTIQKGIQFFRGRLVDGTLSRLNFCTIVPDKSKPFVYGKYDEAYAEMLKPYIANLNLAGGHIECRQALDLARRMAEQCAEEGSLADDEVYEELAHRAVTIAYLKAMVLYIASDMTWSKEIADFAEWSLRYDLWCKIHFFGQLMHEEEAQETLGRAPVRKNLLDLLPSPFSLKEAQEMRRQLGMSQEGCSQMISNWIFRGYIDSNPDASLYSKTKKYLSRSLRL